MVIERRPVSQQALAELRRTILTGAIPPGTKLVVRPLAEEFGLSPTPVKTALAALEAEGLVRGTPNRGYSVATFDAAAIREIGAVRGALDRLAAELAAQAPGHAALAKQLKHNLTEQRAAVRRSDQQRYGDLNHEFHQMIWESTGNRRLAEAANNLAGQVRLLVNSSAQGAGRLAQSLSEHQSMIDALTAGDADRAGALALSHALHSEETLLALASQQSA